MSENRLGVFEMSELTTTFVRKEIRLSEEIYYYMLMQVPQGRLTRDCDIREYLNGIYGATWIDFDILAALRTLLGYSEYMERIVKRLRSIALFQLRDMFQTECVLKNCKPKDLRFSHQRGTGENGCLIIKNICSISKRHRQSTRLF